MARFEPGAFTAEAYLASGVVDFEFSPRRASAITTFVRPTTAGTVQLFRRDSGGTLRAIGTAIVVAGDAENVQLIDYPMGGSIVVRFTDTADDPGTVSCEVADDGDYR